MSEVPGPIRWLVGNYHVATPDSEVEADIRRRSKKAKATVEQTEQNVRWALQAHHENLEEYRMVMSGRF